MSPELRRKLHSPNTHHTQGTPSCSKKVTPKPPKQKRPFQPQRKPTMSKGKQPNPITIPHMASKRKNTIPDPPTMKQLKIDHFLEKGHDLTLNPT
jgi:hypothetical protein